MEATCTGLCWHEGERRGRREGGKAGRVDRVEGEIGDVYNVNTQTEACSYT